MSEGSELLAKFSQIDSLEKRTQLYIELRKRILEVQSKLDELESARRAIEENLFDQFENSDIQKIKIGDTTISRAGRTICYVIKDDVPKLKAWLEGHGYDIGEFFTEEVRRAAITRLAKELNSECPEFIKRVFVKTLHVRGLGRRKEAKNVQRDTVA